MIAQEEFNYLVEIKTGLEDLIQKAEKKTVSHEDISKALNLFRVGLEEFPESDLWAHVDESLINAIYRIEERKEIVMTLSVLLESTINIKIAEKEKEIK